MNRTRTIPLVLLLVSLVLTAWGALAALRWTLPSVDSPQTTLRHRYASTHISDREGRSLGDIRGPGQTRTSFQPLDNIAPVMVQATLFSEDKRFFSHWGVDPMAIARATWSNLVSNRIVSGASTIPQQVVRMMAPRPRTWENKLREAMDAVALDRDLTKEEVLTLYLNYAPYGPLVRGVEMASQSYFQKPAQDLTLAEAAFLTVLPRAPTALNPRQNLAGAMRLQRALLERMADEGAITPAALSSALGQGLEIERPRLTVADHHLMDTLVREDASLESDRPTELRTTIDYPLQRRIQALARTHVRRLEDHQVDNASVVVIHVPSGTVRAVVGSTSYFDQEHLGANNGSVALRQPGSALKPFTYGLAFSQGVTPASILADIEASYETPTGAYTPRNYSQRYHGPVRARSALANSLNASAVDLASTVGTEALLRLLRDTGFSSLDRVASHYGLSLTLGAGEVTLLQLTNAYAALARGGRYQDALLVRWTRDEIEGQRWTPQPGSREVLDPASARLVTHVLSDPVARTMSFGRRGSLELPFTVAAKTGTSTGFRDNWAVGYTDRFAVGVWVGRFDGRPMMGVSGVSGAGPLFRDVMIMLEGDRAPGATHTDGLASVRICALSGMRAGRDCPQSIDELFHPKHTVTETCRMHRTIHIDPDNGLRSTPGCTDTEAVPKTVVEVPLQYRHWARQVGLNEIPDRWSERCDEGARQDEPIDDAPTRIQIASPLPHSTYYLDSTLPASSQEIQLLAYAQPRGERLRWEVNGDSIASGVKSGQALWWRPSPGTHHLVAISAQGQVSAHRQVVVESSKEPDQRVEPLSPH